MKQVLLFTLLCLTGTVYAQSGPSNVLKEGGLLLSAPGYYQQNPQDPATEELRIQLARKYEIWSSASAALLPADSTAYAYDESGLRVSSLIYEPEINGSWSLDRRQTYTYNEENLLTELLTERLTDGDWELYLRQVRQYNGNGDQTEYRNEYWDVTTQSWKTDRASTYEYDAATGLLIARTDYDQDNSGVLVKDERQEYTYDEDGRRTMFLYLESPDNEEWVFSRRSTLTYEGDAENPAQALIETYQGNGIWENSRRATYTAEPEGVLLSTLTESWNSSTQEWEPYSWSESLRDSQGRIFERNILVWLNGEWVNSIRVIFDYTGEVEVETLQTWQNDHWRSLRRYTDYYGIILNTEATHMGRENIAVFPNPAADQIQINLPDVFRGSSSEWEVELYNQTGQRLFSQPCLAAGGRIGLALPQLPAGPYILLLTNGKARFSQKLQINR